MKNLIRFVTGFVVMLPLWIFAAPIWLFVWTVRKLDDGQKNFSNSWKKIIRYDADVGWKPRPNLKSVVYYDKSGDKGSVTTDHEGWPGKYNIKESDVIVFGDSFAFGYGAREKKAYYNIARPQRVKPIAAPAYNMVQSLLWMRRYRRKLSGKLVIWMICLENDLVENLRLYQSKGYTTPFMKQDEGHKTWSIENSHIDTGKWPGANQCVFNDLKFAAACTPGDYSDRVYSACRYLIHEAAGICDTAGARLVVFTIPDREQLSKAGIDMLKAKLPEPDGFDAERPDREIAEICSELSVSFFSGKEYLNIEDYKIRDGHWNRKGNIKVAKLIKEIYQKEGDVKKKRKRRFVSAVKRRLQRI